MKTIIYYFTGTGNSLAVAKKIATVLGDCEIIPIASLQTTADDIIPAADRVGIINPVYFVGLPVMVAEFAGRLDLSGTKYVFSVVTFGGSGAAPALQQLDSILKRRGTHGLDAGFMVKMPGNYILMYESPAGEKREKILASADAHVADSAVAINRNESVRLPTAFLSGILHYIAYPGFASHVHDNDRKFSVNEKCTSCGTCAAVCPAGNIELLDGKPVWKHHCELCSGASTSVRLKPSRQARALQPGSGTIILQSE